MDYRKLNECTRNENFPFPNIHEQLYDLNGAKIFSQIDLDRGYNQVILEEESKKYTAFICQFGVYEFNRMPFGLKNAPKSFQKVMIGILGDLKYIKVFLDDILVFSANMHEHEAHLQEVFQRLHKNGCKINFEKSKFGKNQAKYIGFIIDSNGIRADIERVNYIRTQKSPKTKKELQKLINFINWFRNFIPHCSIKIKPITDKLKNCKNITWNRNDKQVLEDIFQDIEKQIILSHPDYSKKFELYTDACVYRVSGILKQGKNVIGIFSRKLVNSEMNYTTTENEFLAIYPSVQKFRNIIFGARVDVFTDNRNIIFNNNINTSRIEKWKLGLYEYDLNFFHIAGEKNGGADFLSRCCIVSGQDLRDIVYKAQRQIIKTNDCLDEDLQYKNINDKVYTINK